MGQYYDASDAVDGNTEMFISTEPIGLTHPNKTVWWKVDHGKVFNIYSINIQFKNYDGKGVQLYIIHMQLTYDVLIQLLSKMEYINLCHDNITKYC